MESDNLFDDRLVLVFVPKGLPAHRCSGLDLPAPLRVLIVAVLTLKFTESLFKFRLGNLLLEVP